jgi:hypothetical protein
MLAYLDAGTGSMVIGAVAAGVAGAGVAVRSTLGKFRRKNKTAENEDRSAEEQTADKES